MNGYDTAEGYHIGPLDDRDVENPDYTIDPMFSDTGNHGGDRSDRHRGLTPEGEYEGRTAAEMAAFDPEAEVML